MPFFKKEYVKTFAYICGYFYNKIMYPVILFFMQQHTYYICIYTYWICIEVVYIPIKSKKTSCCHSIPNMWWRGWPYLHSYTMLKLDKWDTKVLVRESWNSSFVWLAEPICHGSMSTLLNSWGWSLLLLQFSSVITYVIRLNFWKGSFLLASAPIRSTPHLSTTYYSRFIKTKFGP